MSNISRDWDRLRQVIEWAGMTVNAFALHIGMSRSEVLYHVKRGQNAISRNVADMIVAKFPQVSRTWLLTGSGAMLAGDESQRMIPCYDCEFSMLALTPNSQQITSYVSIPGMEGVDLALVYHEDDMSPSIPRGTMLFLGKIDLQEAVFGEEYMFVCQKNVTLRSMHACDDPSCLRLVAANDVYGEQIVATADIREVYAVLAKLLMNFNNK